MRNTYTAHNDYQAVVNFIRSRVKAGAKQTDIAQGIGKSVSFINRLYLDKNVKKIIDPEIQEKIARYFGISREEMLTEGRKNQEVKEIEKIKKSLNSDKRPSYDFPPPSWAMYEAPHNDLCNQLKRAAMFLSEGIAEMQFQEKIKIKRIKEEAEKEKQEIIRKFEEKITTLETEIELGKALLDALDEGITYFNPERECIFSSKNSLFFSEDNRHILGQFPTIDRILLFLRRDIYNFDEAEKKMQEAFDTRKPLQFTIKMRIPESERIEVKIKTRPIFDGILIRNSFDCISSDSD
jgi:transcriptional regulator with XRE-family HTH domain